MRLGRAGSRRHRPGWRGRLRPRTWWAPAPEGLDDAHAPAAAGTWRERIGRFHRFGRFFWRRYGQELAGAGDAGLAGSAGEQPVMPDAVEATWQDMQQEATHELVGIEYHDLLALRTC